ncbi:hypothetical protein ACSBR2_039182 [Camellia fascicularis]
MAPPTQEQVQEVMKEPGGKESGEDEKEISAYIVVRFGGCPTVASIYHVKIGIGGGEGAAVIRGKEGELLHPLLEFGEGGSRYLTCGVLGSDMYAFTGNRDWYAPLPPVVGPYIFNTETKKIYEPVCLPAIAPKTTCWVISVQDKFFVLSNNLCSGKPVLQPSFELFDPKSGKPVKCTNVVQGDDWLLHPVDAFNHSARIAPAGKDMLCVVHAHESTMSCDTQIVSIKILQTQGPLSLKI